MKSISRTHFVKTVRINQTSLSVRTGCWIWHVFNWQFNEVHNFTNHNQTKGKALEIFLFYTKFVKFDTIYFCGYHCKHSYSISITNFYKIMAVILGLGEVILVVVLLGYFSICLMSIEHFFRNKHATSNCSLQVINERQNIVNTYFTCNTDVSLFIRISVKLESKLLFVSIAMSLYGVFWNKLVMQKYSLRY